LTNSLSDLAQTASEQPVVDSQKVNEIRQAIEEGRYKVSPERIAAGLIRMEGL
jgi:negative regulator of flagellin synthesis FlgM